MRGVYLTLVDKAFLKSKLRQSEEMVKREKELNRLKDHFVSVVSHELKTPITPLKIQTELLLEGKLGGLNEKQKKSLEMIVRNMDRLNELIDDILELSRIQSGRLKLEPKETDLKGLFKDVFEIMKPYADKKKINLKMNIEEGLPKTRIDRQKIREVVINLMHNAVKFTDPKGIIEVNAKKHDDKIMLSVKDNGIGIKPNDQKKIFEPFFQTETSLERTTTGTGVGLSIVKGIVEAHQGKIWLRSALGKGTTFYVSLPIR